MSDNQRLQIERITPGDGETYPAKGDRVKIHYVGTLQSKTGKEFDSSRRRGKPFECRIGVGDVIAGWDEGVVQLSLGEKAYLVCPPHIGEQSTNSSGLISRTSSYLRVPNKSQKKN